MFAINTENLKKIKMTYIFKKKLSADINFEKCFKENNQLRY